MKLCSCRVFLRMWPRVVESKRNNEATREFTVKRSSSCRDSWELGYRRGLGLLGARISLIYVFWEFI